MNNIMAASNNKPVLIIQNATAEPAGLFEELLKENSIPYQVADLEKKENLPPTTNFGAIIVMGGPSSANDATDVMIQELITIREALATEIPYLGVCLGLQTLVKAAGGSVIQWKEKEIGFRKSQEEFFKIKLSEAGKNDPILQAIDDEFPIFHLHGETVVTTDSMQLLGKGNGCINQLVKAGNNSYGIQGHIELTQPLFGQWMDNIVDFQTIDKNKCQDDFKNLWADYHKTGKQFFLNFLNIAGYLERE